MSDQTKALTTALRDSSVYNMWDDVPLYAAAILAALPEGTALFTVDSLAAALRDSSVYDMWDEDDGRYSDKDYAAAIIQAAKKTED